VKILESLKTSYIAKLVLEYGELSTREHLLEDEADRMAEILLLATNDPLLDFWLSEIDYCLGHHLGLLDDEDRNYYRNQQALLSEYAECNIPKYLIDKVSSHSRVGVVAANQLSK
jgi:hypothetical protein